MFEGTTWSSHEQFGRSRGSEHHDRWNEGICGVRKSDTMREFERVLLRHVRTKIRPRDGEIGQCHCRVRGGRKRLWKHELGAYES